MIRKHPLFILLVAALGLLAAWYLRSILLYILIAAVITILVAPLDKYLERIRIRSKKMPRTLRAFLMLLSVYAVIGVFVAVFIPLIVDEIRVISTVDRTQLQQAIHEPVTQLETMFSQLNQQTGGNRQTLEQYVQEKTNSLLGLTQVSTLANSVFSTLGSLLTGFLVVSFLTFFFLRDGVVIFEMAMLLVPPRFQKQVRNVVEDSRLLLTKYITAVLLDVLFVAAVVGTGCALLGLKNALIIGLFAGVMNIIPYLGTFIAAGFAIVIGVSTNLHLDFYTGMLPLAGKISLVFVIMNLLDAFLVQPYLFSNSVKAHPIEIFVVILIAGTLAGIGGMVVAVPTYTVLRIIAREFFNKYRFVQRLTDELDNVTDPETPPAQEPEY